MRRFEYYLWRFTNEGVGFGCYHGQLAIVLCISVFCLCRYFNDFVCACACHVDWQPLGPVRLTMLRVGLRQVAQDTYNGTAN